MNLRALGVVISVLTATAAWSSMPVPMPMKELYGLAKVVGIVEVLEGRVVDAGGETCGARYKGRVVQGIKNATIGQVVEFGYVPSLRIGSQYLVLLDDYANVPLERDPAFQARCKGALPGQALVGLWRGAMEVFESVAISTQGKSWTLRPVKYVTYPVGTRTTTERGNLCSLT